MGKIKDNLTHIVTHFWLAKIFIGLNKADEACAHFVKAYELGHLAAKDELMNHCDYTEDSFEDEEL